jgi:hypothetical protein
MSVLLTATCTNDEGLYKTIKEIRFEVKDPKRIMLMHLGPGEYQKPIMGNRILQVTLNRVSSTQLISLPLSTDGPSQ